MKIRRCLKCMTALGDGVGTCPVCGRVYGASASESFALRPGTILDGKYLVGEMLGQGGFGITYLGFDLLLEQKVAIKEYFPMSTGMVSREGQSTVVWSTAMMGKTGAERGFDSFLKEARKMAKLGGIPGVVGVKSVFIENETAYIVMDYIEGETLQKKLEREGPMDFGTCVTLLTPMIHSLGQVHSHGIIHRDISPDNIMVQKDGTLILLDLGAAKDLDIQKPDGTIQSSQLVAKHGFSPFEQYGTTGKIGPWTDVYAMAATIYYCCTGKIPPTAVDRRDLDTLTCCSPLTEAQFEVLSEALTVQQEDRIQDMDTFIQLLTDIPQTPIHIKRKTRKRLKRLAIALILVGLCLALVVALRHQKEVSAIKTETMPPLTEAATLPKETTKPVQTYVMAAMGSAGSDTNEERDTTTFWGQPLPSLYNQETTGPTEDFAVPEVETTSSFFHDESVPPREEEARGYIRCEVEHIIFHDTLSNVGEGAWDVSESGDASILAWMEGNVLHVAADGIIAPNPNASFLFDSFTNLKSVDFGSHFDTSGVINMYAMFYNCTSLTSLDVTCFDTSSVTNMGFMFNKCDSLTGLDVSGFHTENVGNMSYIFCGCGGLDNLDVSGFDTSNVGDMSYMFYGCSGLDNLDVSGFDTSNVGDMSYMFYGCSGLTSLDVSGFDTSSVGDMRHMFDGCANLTGLNLSGFDTGSVGDMSCMFSGCSNLPSLNLSGFDTKNVGNMACMFYDCGKLNSLNVSGFNTRNVGNMYSMFYNCSSLKSLDVSGFDTRNVKDTSYMFDSCRSLTNLNVSGFDTARVEKMQRMFFGCSYLKELNVSGFDTSNVTDMNYMFGGCANLTSLDVSGFNTSKVSDMHGMFSECAMLAELDVSRWDTSNVEYMGIHTSLPYYLNGEKKTADGGMFSVCSNLKQLDVSGFDTSNVTNMYRMFYNCGSLTSLDVSGFQTSKVTSMASMFRDCSELKKLEVSGFNTSNVTEMNCMFCGCKSLTKLDVSGFDTSRVESMSSMFEGCSGLTKLDVSGFNTAQVEGMGDMFNGCMSLTKLDVTGFDTSKVWYMTNMFNGCSKLTSLDLRNFDTSKLFPKYGANGMFKGCTSLKDFKCTDKQLLEAYKER